MNLFEKILHKKFIEKQIKSRLAFIYGKDRVGEIFSSFKEIFNKYKNLEIKKKDLFSEEDVFLITYADHIKKERQMPLDVLNEFYNKYLKEIINTVHILPFYPYSSDDGFSVIDYKKVKSDFGDWDLVNKLGNNCNLMFDLVLNHISSKSEWFNKFCEGDEKYKDYFITVDPELDLSNVVRPRNLPLLHDFEIKQGKKYVWTTFSRDQVDINFSNPDVLLEMIDIFLFYAQNGASVIRLDAIAYLWKQIETTCIHLPQTHEIVKLFRDIIEYLNVDILLLTETNVPHKDNVSYFGNGNDEAHMIYQFSLPPLLAHAILREDISYLTKWADSLEFFTDKTTYFNFTASHDGIGVRPVEGILPSCEVDYMLEKTQAREGSVSYKINADGTKSPYELNINYLSFLSDKDEEDDIKVKKFMATQAVMLSLKGIPGIYMHSILGSCNYVKGVSETGISRAINREKLDFDNIEQDLSNSDSLRFKVFQKYKQLLLCRKKIKAFHPNAEQKVLSLDKRVFALNRISIDKKEIVFILVNFSKENVDIDFNVLGYNGCEVVDVLNDNQEILLDSILRLKPYDIRWFVLWK